MPNNFRQGDLVKIESGNQGTIESWRVHLDGAKWFFYYTINTSSGIVDVREDLISLPQELLEARLKEEEENKKNKYRDEKYNATVVDINMRHEDLAIFRVKPDGDKATYDPGQYTTLGLYSFEGRLEGTQNENPAPEFDSFVQRAYSISHRILDDETSELVEAGNDDFFEFYIVLVRDNGEGNPAPGLTPRLFELKEGSRIHIGKKAVGHYTLHHVNDSTKTIILGGTGTGEAPHMGMIAKLLSTGYKGDIVCLEVCRSSADFGYFETHKKLMERYSNYKYVGLATRDPNIKEKVYIQDYISKGMLDDLLGYKPTPDTSHWYFCGNPKMLGVPVKDKETGKESYPTPLGVIEVLEGMGHKADRGVKNPGNIHYEEYW
tara:strand:+ start:1289 stop:2419 length:1131 start_codon:yes stop_codon:yes gene_type:complete